MFNQHYISPTVHLSKSQVSHKLKLIGMAMRSGGSGVSGWTFARVSRSFLYERHSFMDTDIIVVRKERDSVTVLCTRSIEVVQLPEAAIENFVSLEEPFPTLQLSLPDR